MAVVKSERVSVKLHVACRKIGLTQIKLGSLKDGETIKMSADERADMNRTRAYLVIENM